MMVFFFAALAMTNTRLYPRPATFVRLIATAVVKFILKLLQLGMGNNSSE